MISIEKKRAIDFFNKNPSRTILLFSLFLSVFIIFIVLSFLKIYYISSDFTVVEANIIKRSKIIEYREIPFFTEYDVKYHFDNKQYQERVRLLDFDNNLIGNVTKIKISNKDHKYRESVDEMKYLIIMVVVLLVFILAECFLIVAYFKNKKILHKKISLAELYDKET
jgi:hypothetical protein